MIFLIIGLHCSVYGSKRVPGRCATKHLLLKSEYEYHSCNLVISAVLLSLGDWSTFDLKKRSVLIIKTKKSS